MGIEIKIDDEWAIKSDDLQYTLGVYQVDEEGKMRLRKTSYYRTIEEALKSYLEKKLRTSDAKSFKELKEIAEEVKEKIEEIHREIMEV